MNHIFVDLKGVFLLNKTLRRIFLIFADISAIAAATLLSLFISCNFKIGDINVEDWKSYLIFFGASVVISLAMFAFFHLYSSVWKYASIIEVLNIFAASLISICALVVLMNIIGRRIPYVFYLDYFFLQIFIVLCVRFFYRFVRMLKKGLFNGNSDAVNVMIVGAGEAGSIIAREISQSGKLKYRIACIVDDNPDKKGSFVGNHKIMGNRNDIPELAKKYNVKEIMIALPSAKKEEIQKILEICKETGCKLKTLPSIFQIVNGEIGVASMREVQIEDLLGRDTIDINTNENFEYIVGKTVLVTGGGGSIGSELCRQIAKHAPKRLIIVDIYENNAYDIQQELKTTRPELDLVVLIASVRDVGRLESVFEEYKPDVVYHAAAHKHVPLMEDSPNEAIKNNVFGTLNVVRTADKYGVKRFVMISTDKAVNPTNIMGASKRICEMIVQTYDRRSKTEFVAVRFGNVLGSNGSVIPLFKRQIAAGGPVLVTHPDIIRYFMTIPEAVSLVICAGSKAKGGEIFVLDMGKPVKILDLATNLIKLSGYTPGKDIKIEFTGLRPGEKLYEEMLMDEEGLQSTDNELIHIGKPIDIDEDVLFAKLDELHDICNGEKDGVYDVVHELVPTFTGHPQAL